MPSATGTSDPPSTTRSGSWAYALGATPIALALAGVIFVFTATTYAEGVSLVPTAGGSVAFARRAFNDMFSFVAGWALALNYIVTTAISAVSAAFYLSHFWPPFRQPGMAALGGIAMTGLLMLLNIRGVRETARLNTGFAILDLATQGLLVLLGISLVLGGWRNLLSYPSLGPDWWPDTRRLVFGVAIAMVAYVGLESAAQMAEETKVPTRTVPRALLCSVVTVIFMFAALPIVALCAMPPRELVNDCGNDPVAGIASKLPTIEFGHPHIAGHMALPGIMMPWVAILACTILLIAANAGILAGSRITYNMAKHRQVFAGFGRVHPRYQTPHLAIVTISLVAIAIIAAGTTAKNLLLRLGDLYVFGAMMAFSMAHLSVWLLRIKEPDAHRPFRAWPNIPIGGRSISVTATIGFLSCAAIWMMIAVTPEHAFGRYIGGAWVIVGLAFYVWFRRSQGLDLTQSVVAEEVSALVASEPAPRRREMTREIRHILIPVHSPEYADQMTRIACDLASLYVADITAVYAIEVPRALPVDAELTSSTELAQRVLEVAAYIADTVYDKRIETVTLQARRAGAAIVEYAAAEHVDLILLSVMHGGPRTRDAVMFGTTADYNAPCQVWMVRAEVNHPKPAGPRPTPTASREGD